MCLVKPLVYKHDVGICRIKLPLQFGKLTSPASHRTLSRLHVKSSTVITWDYDPLFVVFFDSVQSLRGYYLHRAHLACAVP